MAWPRRLTLVKPGNHVICSWNPSCGHCFYCDRGQPILCEVFTSTQRRGHLMDGASRLRIGGEKLHHFSEVSSHAEYCVVPESGAIPVPAEMPFDRACLIGCGVMTGVGGTWYMAGVTPGEHVAVAGCGAVGLNAVQGARMAGADTIVAIDVNPNKLEMARTLGATHTVNAETEDAVELIKGLTGGRGVDCSIECAGSEATLQLCLEAARPGARVIILGKTSVDAMVSLRRQLGLTGGDEQIETAAGLDPLPEIDAAGDDRDRHHSAGDQLVTAAARLAVGAAPGDISSRRGLRSLFGLRQCQPPNAVVRPPTETPYSVPASMSQRHRCSAKEQRT